MINYKKIAELRGGQIQDHRVHRAARLVCSAFEYYGGCFKGHSPYNFEIVDAVANGKTLPTMDMSFNYEFNVVRSGIESCLSVAVAHAKLHVGSENFWAENPMGKFKAYLAQQLKGMLVFPSNVHYVMSACIYRVKMLKTGQAALPAIQYFVSEPSLRRAIDNYKASKWVAAKAFVRSIATCWANRRNNFPIGGRGSLGNLLAFTNYKIRNPGVGLSSFFFAYCVAKNARSDNSGYPYTYAEATKHTVLTHVALALNHDVKLPILFPVAVKKCALSLFAARCGFFIAVIRNTLFAARQHLPLPRVFGALHALVHHPAALKVSFAQAALPAGDAAGVRVVYMKCIMEMEEGNKARQCDADAIEQDKELARKEREALMDIQMKKIKEKAMQAIKSDIFMLEMTMMMGHDDEEDRIKLGMLKELLANDGVERPMSPILLAPATPRLDSDSDAESLILCAPATPLLEDVVDLPAEQAMTDPVIAAFLREAEAARVNRRRLREVEVIVISSDSDSDSSAHQEGEAEKKRKL
jgi:hypothetical protein